MTTFWANQILDENKKVIFAWVMNDPGDSINLEGALEENFPQEDWRKPHHLKSWLKANKPKWEWRQKERSIQSLFVFP
jgi:hypothetical protein